MMCFWLYLLETDILLVLISYLSIRTMKFMKTCVSLLNILVKKFVRQKVIKLWTTFLESILGITSRPSSEGVEESGKARSYTSKAVKASIEGNGNMLVTEVSKSICNVDETLSPEKEIPDKISMVNGNTSAKKETAVYAEKERVGSWWILFVVEVKDLPMEVLRFLFWQTIFMGVQGMVYLGDLLTFLSTITTKIGLIWLIDVPSVQGGNIPKPGSTENGVLRESAKGSRYHKDAAETSKIEKEGGLSPNGCFEDNFAVYEDGSSLAIPKTKHSDQRLP